MNDTSKLLLTVVIGGTILGAGLSRHVSTLMNPGPESDWRDRYRSSYSDSAVQFVDAGPIDLSPALPWPGGPFGPYAAMAQAPIDYGPEYGAGYRIDDYTIPRDAAEELAASYDAQPPAPVADAVHEAATTATVLQQAADPPTAEAPPARVIFGVDSSVSSSGMDAARTANAAETPTAL